MYATQTYFFPFLVGYAEFILYTIFPHAKRFALFNFHKEWNAKYIQYILVKMRYGYEHFIFRQMHFIAWNLFEAINYLLGHARIAVLMQNYNLRREDKTYGNRMNENVRLKCE